MRSSTTQPNPTKDPPTVAPPSPAPEPTTPYIEPAEPIRLPPIPCPSRPPSEDPARRIHETPRRGGCGIY